MSTIRLTLLFILFFIQAGIAFSQDLIILKSGDEIQAKVLEITDTQVKYKKWDNPDGPSYTSPKSDIFMIKYPNGTKDVFKDATSPAAESNTTNTSNDGERVAVAAEQYMAAVIEKQSGGSCLLTSFRKENGVQQNVNGQRVYAITYALIIEVQRTIWKHSEGLFQKDWFWEHFAIASGEADQYAQAFQGIQSKNYSKGDRIEITGSISFAMTDNGWIPSGVSSFSYGYDNSSSRDLGKSENKPIPEKNPSTITTQGQANPTNNNTSSTEIKTNAPATDTYEGGFVDGKRNGNGVMRYTNGDVYEGNWVNGEREGNGKMKYDNGKIYIGSWKQGKKEGQGKMNYNDGSSFEGEWINDEYGHRGTVIWATGAKYTGELVDRQMNGQGIYTGVSGATMEGTFKDGLLEGNGVFKVKSADAESILEGQFHLGDLHGQGTQTTNYADGQVIIQVGEFRTGDLYNGELESTESDGKRYAITYVNGEKGKKRRVSY